MHQTHEVTDAKLVEFEGNVERRGEDECWIWRGAGRTYGTMYWPAQRASGLAHRIAFQLDRGREIAPGLDIDHVCGETRCVNPRHLEEVTRSENLRRLAARRQSSGASLPPRNTNAVAHDEFDPNQLVSLGDPRALAACGVTADKGLFQCKRRSEQRIARGSQEAPFPAPVEMTAGANLYWLGEIVQWHRSHTSANNPSRRCWKDVVPDA